MCSEVFDIPPEEVYERVAFTNAYYGGNRPKGSRIIFVNGEDFQTQSVGCLSSKVPAGLKGPRERPQTQRMSAGRFEWSRFPITVSYSLGATRSSYAYTWFVSTSKFVFSI